MAKKDENSKMPDRGTPPREAGLSVVATGTRVTGQLDTSGVVKIEGTVAGSVRAERQVLVAKGGVVEGDILTREVVVGGTVTGAIFSDERVEVQSTAQIHGDITTKRILLQEGGEVNGNLKMEDPKALERKPGSGAAEDPKALERKPGSGAAQGGSSPRGAEESWKQPMAGAPQALRLPGTSQGTLDNRS